MIAAGLLFYYSRQVLSYGLQFSLLTLLVQLLGGVLFGGGASLEELPWIYLNLLAWLGPPSGIALQAFYHREEKFLYANQSLSRRWLWPAAALIVWLAAGLALAALRFYDGRLQRLLVQGQTQAAQLGAAGSGWMRQYPLIPAAAAALLGLALLLLLLLRLTWQGEDDSEDGSGGWELAIDSASHAFRGRRVLKAAWLACRSGEIVGLLGRNGCGKSTLLQILFGTLRADFSAEFVNGRPVKSLFRLPGLAAYLPQASFLPRRMRVARAVRLFAGPQALAKLTAEPRIRELLASRVYQLSGGERRFLELALMLTLERPFVLLDEPFSELEPLYKQHARELIAAAAAAGSGVILTDHDYQQILQVSQRVVLMHGGETRPVHDRSELEKLYLPS